VVTSTGRIKTQFTIAAGVLNVVVAAVVVLLSHLEHVKSIRPSFLLSAYLFASLLFDATRVRTEWLLSVNAAYASILTTSTAVKVLMLTLETVEKRKLLLGEEQGRSRESTSGPLSRGLFVWLTDLLTAGFATVLTVSDLPSIFESLKSAKVFETFHKAWSRGP
jgi:ATP-binding cassette, subfamily C (CFTR/MRP), member 1